MAIIVLIGSGITLLALVVTGWKLACRFMVWMLDIPSPYQSAYEAEEQHLPYYLDDRVPPPKL
jgi:hypothetical protein